MEPTAGPGQLLAISDLHISYPENRALVEQLHPAGAEDWLIVAGDIAETVEDIRWTLATLAARFRKVLWTPGNHDLWTHPKDPVQLRGVARYEHLVQVCRELGVLTPEDPYPVWQGPGGPVAVAPLFLGYDYSFLPAGCATKAEGLAYAESTGIVCNDEYLLHPDPYPSREAWCRERVASTEERLAALPADLPTVLANHYPLHRHPTEVLWHPEFAMWCGTELTADWHRRFRVATMVYGHLHIPRTTWHDGVRFTEVSVGYPREWRKRSQKPGTARRILPMEEREEVEAGDRGAAPGVGRGRGGTS
ncbi:metallophosphoesterase family protein [Streptomyces sp. CL12]|uniref:metallophosphoesterase family protein n=1 Tax=Streptomyces sp. CL12 TaxID=3391744 RepID=UPI003A811D9D